MTPYEKCLAQLAATDERIVVLTAENRAAIRSLPNHLGNRFIDVGICEQTLLGVAAGLAARGRRPIVHALAAFLTMRGFEFIRTDIGIGRLPVILVGGVPGLLSDGNGPTHQAIEDMSLMRGIPGMSVVAPADQWELTQGIATAVRNASPSYIRYYDAAPSVEHHGEYDFGCAEFIGSAQAPVVIAAYGLLLAQAIRAQQLLRQQSINACVLNMRTLAPLDKHALDAVAASARLVTVLEDHFEVGGLFSAIAEHLALSEISIPLLPINLKHDWFRAGLLDDAMNAAGLSGHHVAEAIVARLEKVNARHHTRTVNLPTHRTVECDMG